MGRYLVIENEPKLTEQISEAVKAIDTNCEILKFDTYSAFEKKLLELKPEEKTEFMKFNFYLLNVADRPTKEWKKMIDDLKAGASIKEAEICISCFDGKAAPLNFLKQLGVFNVLFKPFDPLILKETIHLAQQKDKLAKPIDMKSQKSSAFIGVLKEVELHSISELGFVTISDAQIPIGGLTKYFSPLFSAGKKQSVWAQCLLSAPHPGKPGHFINKFQFFYVKKDFLSQIRKYVASQKAQETSSAMWNLEGVSKVPKIRMALLATHGKDNDGLQKDLQERFTNVEVEFFDHAVMDSWAKDQTHDLVLSVGDLQFDQIKPFFKESARFFWMAQSEIKEDNLKDLSLNYKDIFTLPLDRSYFYKKMKAHIIELVSKEALYLMSVSCHEIIKAANTIKVSDINEVYIDFHYSRELGVGDFREFLFLKGEDEQAIEIPAFCHYKEKAQNVQPGDKNIFFHQFFFFAMNDHFQKEIRLWLLHNYIVQNKKES